MLRLPEHWKPIPGFEGLYEVSDRGRVRSIRRERLLVLTPDKEGYLCVTFSVRGRHWCKKVHRLVLETFGGPCPQGQQCRHLDGDRLNNAPDNLKWGTSKEDAADRLRHGVHPLGERVGNAKLSDAKVRMILESKAPAKELAKMFGVAYTLIDKVRRREIWRHVSC